MAQLALNRFQTETLVVTTADQTVYTAPTGYTAIVLYAHVTNISSSAASFTMSHVRSSTTTEIVKDATVPPSDAFIPLDGKLVLETSDSIKISASANSSLKLILSVLETAT
jgi:hypothetical protein|tara:strand:+ start:302 stop:634 length:333 start_codon:yes stop_codon:yes gene_type:complete